MGMEECNLFLNNQTDPFHIGNTYGGLPTNLITNTIGWTLLMLMFLLVRKSAYKYIKLKQIERITSELNLMGKITQIFFSGDVGDNKNGDVTVFDDSGENHENQQEQQEEEVVQGRPTFEEGFDEENANDESKICVDENKQILNQKPELENHVSIEENEGFWSWLIKVFTLTDGKLRIMAGDDAVQYLRFQRYLIGYIFITTLLSIGVVLPLNFQGELQGNTTDFEHTTLSNLNPESPYLWIHITIAFVLFPIAIFTMRRFSTDLKFRDPSLEITRTLCIENIPYHMCKEELLRKHFKEAYPRFNLYDCKVVYDVAKLTESNNELMEVLSCYQYGVRHKEKHDEDLMMYPYCASRCCCCLCAPCSTPVPVVEYYGQKLAELRNKVKEEKEKSLHSPLGMAFVTFKSVNNARVVFEDYEKTVLLTCKNERPSSSLSTSMMTSQWKVWFAPPPKDIYWENLSVQSTWMFLKVVFSNVVLFFVAFFLTTPEYLVSQFDTIIIAMFGPEYDFQNSSGGSWLKDFIPTILLWSFTALLPLLVAYSERWLGRWTRSEENHSVMRKTFWYLLFMVIILPTFGFTTGKAYFDFIFQENGTENYRWECIFLPDSGAFFVNYVITAALIGSGLELIRFPEMFWYLLQVCCSRSEAEGPSIQRRVTYEFRFGEQYARMLLIFAMVMMYSLSCPLITPFGCLYFLLKHFADRHNLAFVYARSKINRKVHASAINFVIMSVGLLQFFMVVFSIIRSGNIQYLTSRTKYALVLFVITINIFTAQIWSNFCKKLSPIKYEDVLFLEDGDDEHNQEYVPNVLKDVYPGERLPSPAPSQTASTDSSPSGYGTFVTDLITVEPQ